MHFKQQIWVADDNHIWVSCCFKDIAPISWGNKQPRPWYCVLKDCQPFVVCHAVWNKQQKQGFDEVKVFIQKDDFKHLSTNILLKTSPQCLLLLFKQTPLLIAHLLLLSNPLSRLLPNLALFHECFPLHLTPLSLNLFSSNGLFLPSTTPSHILNLFQPQDPSPFLHPSLTHFPCSFSSSVTISLPWCHLSSWSEP